MTLGTDRRAPRDHASRAATSPGSCSSARRRRQLAWHVTYRATSTGALRRGRRRRPAARSSTARTCQGARRTPSVYPNHPGAEPAADRGPRGLRPCRPARQTLDGDWSRQWADLDDDNAPDAGGGDAAERRRRLHLPVHALHAATPAARRAKPCAWDPAVHAVVGRRTASRTASRPSTSSLAFTTISRRPDRLHRRLGQLRGRRHRRRRPGADPTRRRRRHRAGGGPDADHRNNANMPPRPTGLADDADVPVPGLPAPAVTSATSTAVTTPASSGTSTRTGSPTASSPTRTAPAR